MKKILLTVLLATAAALALADNPLYETGPGQDSSFVRFLNAGSEAASIVNGSAKLSLDAKAVGRVSRFYPVKAGDKLTATVQIGKSKSTIEVVAKPGEFVTVALLNQGASIESLIVREAPTDFNAMRASLALLNADPSCAAAGLTGGPKNALIFEAVKSASTQRRLLNPVSLKVQVNCAAEAVGSVIDLSQLQAGERYSVILIPAKKGRQAFFVRDSTS
ncbi:MULTISPECIES: cell division protein FtsQ [unclassified Undibacterium]|uniref:cell division protein FtsQ n=1 Tax=unclassified Undibacterium TaxID=2630295 RepID=UPI002AC92668|nr:MULTISPECIES: cell division protein FtsQ [unclassified Undibacterium]MEB0138409.1 cell division protein FtsQ [Undibacterium sp. CCC2.1]MEB0171284.1 cell division protein FtsQ [Undibacterium sp. CCC1.1]MEB0176478.1 cell division protein FtsQ [Undibacterium sp. CCC3.4]MEB0214038.1 cell division protein FtsQ [Undibacterium sp. 5I2]WPX43653.1 cell division protein FtsQ [Undibacterium sp. CCC3.4]